MAASNTVSRQQGLGEEIANAVSHGLGCVLGVAGLVLMLIRAVSEQSALAIGCAIVYGMSLIILYGVSGTYHALPGGKVKSLFRVFDHCSIYLLILGSYVPVALLLVGGKVGWALCLVNGACAGLGIFLNCLSVSRWEKVSLCLYVIMGWSVIFAIKPVFSAMPWPGIMLLSLGGIMYTVGIVFYKANGIRYMHFVWHLFVLAGSIIQFLAIYLYCFGI